VRSPLARLFSSLANVVLDLGLPAIRGWLRDRLGPEADVAEVTTDGSTVTLERVRIPLGPRGLIVLDRATATITSLGDEGPALRLHSFDGVLVFTKPELRDAYLQNAQLRADVAFTAVDDADPSAWIWGDVEIKSASWTTETPGAPLTGRARLFVSSREWRLEGARLDGAPSTTPDGKPPAVARFAAAGSLEQAPPTDSLVPASIASVAFALENGRIGPFLDAMKALAGEDMVRARIPDAIPRDTRLDGELSWSAEQGARAEMRLDAATIGARATVRVAFAPNGGGLEGRIDGTLAPAPLLRRLAVPLVAMPRDEDVITLAVIAFGHVRAPEAQIDVTAPQLGFRMGRPRFVPAVLIRDLAGSIVFKEGRAAGRIMADARGPLAIDLEASRTSTRVAVTADALGAWFLRDLAATMNVRATIIDETTTSIALEHTSEAKALSGRVAIATTRSKLVLELAEPTWRVTGNVAIVDALATGLVENATLFPTRGDVAVALDVERSTGAWPRAHGHLRATELELQVGHRELRYVVQGVSVAVAIDRASLVYEDLRFTGYGGRFFGSGTIPFTHRAPDGPPYLSLTLEEGGAVLARELFLLVPEPRPDLAVPDSLRAVGKLVIGDHLAVFVSLTTAAGTQLAVNVCSHHGNLHGSTAKGTVALADAWSVAKIERPLTGMLHVDADIREDHERSLRGVLSSARVEYPPIALEDASVLVLLTRSGDVLWNRLDARLADGRVSSFGLARKGGEVLARVSAAAVLVQELPPLEGRALGNYVRGRASGSVVGHRSVDETLEAHGDVVLDEAAFPVIDRARPALSRYGLRPPNEDATGPAVASIRLDPAGVHLSDVAVDLHGATVRARVDINPLRVIDGHVEIVLEEEYLRTSKMLTLPRVLGERLVIPINVRGTTEKPDIHAELGQTLGQFLRDTKVGDFITSAVEEAQLFFTSSKRRTMTPPKPVEPPPTKPDWESELRKEVDAHAADWAALATRR
jgi:hypothetical protein